MSDDGMPMGGWDDDEARDTPVNSDRCVFCKYQREAWDDGVTAYRIGENEVMCSVCFRDCREWKRSRTFMLLMHDDFSDDMKALFTDWYDELLNRIRNAGADPTDHGEATKNATVEN